MSPDRHLPRSLRTAGMTVRVLMYVLAAVLGLVDVIVPELVVATVGVGADAWGAGIVALSMAGLVAVALRRWRWEWPVAYWLAALFALRGLVIVTAVPPFDRTAAAVLSLLVSLGFIARGLDLTAFAVKTGQVARRLSPGRT